MPDFPVPGDQLRLWHHARILEGVCAGFMDWHAPGYGRAGVYWFVGRQLGESRRRQPNPHAAGMGVVCGRPRNGGGGDNLYNENREACFGRKNWNWDMNTRNETVLR